MPKAKKKVPGLGEKPLKSRYHENLAHGLIKHKGDGVAAYREVYPATSLASAQMRAKEVIEQNPEIAFRVEYLLAKQGLSPAVLNERLKDMMEGKRQVIHPMTGEIVTIDDNRTLIEALKIGYKLYGYLQTGVNVNIDARRGDVKDMPKAVDDVSLKLINSLKDLNKQLGLSTGEQDGEIIDAEATDVEDGEVVDDDSPEDDNRS